MEELQSSLNSKQEVITQLETQLLEATTQKDQELGKQQTDLFFSLKQSLVERDETIVKLQKEAADFEKRQQQAVDNQKDEEIELLKSQVTEIEQQIATRTKQQENELANKDRHSYFVVEEEYGESDLERGRPHHVDESGGVLQLLAVHGDQVNDLTGCKFTFH